MVLRVRDRFISFWLANKRSSWSQLLVFALHSSKIVQSVHSSVLNDLIIERISQHSERNCKKWKFVCLYTSSNKTISEPEQDTAGLLRSNNISINISEGKKPKTWFLSFLLYCLLFYKIFFIFYLFFYSYYYFFNYILIRMWRFCLRIYSNQLRRLEGQPGEDYYYYSLMKMLRYWINPLLHLSPHLLPEHFHFIWRKM